MSSFDRYYDVFLQNSLRGRRFEISVGGATAIGVPTAGSIADPRNPDVSFNFQDDAGNVHHIRFADLEGARPV